eukprot:scaffold64678_cov58-Phaeocystis_antarctica.AAC.4
MVHEGVGARHVWSTASHEAVPRRRAEGVLRISPLEERTRVGQLVHPRGVHEGVAVRAEIGAEVVHRDEEDIARARVQHRGARFTSTVAVPVPVPVPKIDGQRLCPRPCPN